MIDRLMISKYTEILLKREERQAAQSGNESNSSS